VLIQINRLSAGWNFALGQKQTFAPQNVMSALPPKTDTRQRTHAKILVAVTKTSAYLSSSQIFL
jgi:hypothetical protein